MVPLGGQSRSTNTQDLARMVQYGAIIRRSLLIITPSEFSLWNQRPFRLCISLCNWIIQITQNQQKHSSFSQQDMWCDPKLSVFCFFLPFSPESSFLAPKMPNQVSQGNTPYNTFSMTIPYGPDAGAVPAPAHQIARPAWSLPYGPTGA